MMWKGFVLQDRRFLFRLEYTAPAWRPSREKTKTHHFVSSSSKILFSSYPIKKPNPLIFATIFTVMVGLLCRFLFFLLIGQFSTKSDSANMVALALQSYGIPVNNAAAKQIAAGAINHAKENLWNVAVAVVDTHGMLIYYEMMDDTQTGSSTICIEKAKTASQFRRPTKAFEEGIVNGRTAFLSFGVNMCEGGLPIVEEGKVIGGVGVSGVNSDQDAACAEAGLALLLSDI